MKLNDSPTKKNLRLLKSLYRKAFPRCEKKPFALIRKKRKEGSMEILSAEDENGRFLGFAITILHKDIVLLDYLAVSPDRRGNGLGSQILEHLSRRYEGKRILLEIEDPDAPCKNKSERLRRKSFYLRNGFAVQNYKIWLFGVKMMILTRSGAVSFNEYHEIFEAVFPPKTGRYVTPA